MKAVNPDGKPKLNLNWRTTLNIREIFPSSYLEPSDFEGKTVNLVIDYVRIEQFDGTRRPVLYFRDCPKGLVLDKTNADTITDFYGEEINYWIGYPLEICTVCVSSQKRMLDDIQLRIPTRAEKF